MSIFLDSARLEEVKRAADLSFVGGVTVNPTLVAHALLKSELSHGEFFNFLEELFRLARGRVFVQTNYWDEYSMIDEAARMHSIFGDRLIVKIPFCEEGIKAVYRLKDRGIQVAMTAVFTPVQAYMSAESGADFVVLYCNRLGRIGQDGVETARRTIQLFSARNLATKILIASVRTQIQVANLLEAGAEHLTLPFNLIEEILAHPLSWEAADTFARDLRVLPPEDQGKQPNQPWDRPQEKIFSCLCPLRHWRGAPAFFIERGGNNPLY
jgi:transaldolase